MIYVSKTKGKRGGPHRAHKCHLNMTRKTPLHPPVMRADESMVVMTFDPYKVIGNHDMGIDCQETIPVIITLI